MAVDEQIQSEQDRVEAWRLKTLIEAGYPPEAAATLAARPDIDVHTAAGLLAHGCDPLVAIDILL